MKVATRVLAVLSAALVALTTLIATPAQASVTNYTKSVTGVWCAGEDIDVDAVFARDTVTGARKPLNTTVYVPFPGPYGITYLTAEGHWNGATSTDTTPGHWDPPVAIGSDTDHGSGWGSGVNVYMIARISLTSGTCSVRINSI